MKKQNDMNKIIAIGCSGSGKSTFVFWLEDILKYPTLHLDRIYHLDNDHHIPQEELCKKVEEFAHSHEQFIIDGNYFHTLEHRIKLADTIFFLDMSTKTCLRNVIERTKYEKREDVPETFDHRILKPEFLESILTFRSERRPIVIKLLKKYKKEKTIHVFRSYKALHVYLNKLKKQKSATPKK